ncbi:MAG TPA: methyltransferase [Nitrososphaerales archaeon]|nr:methyltransferase [Nitrososphaerales archaeon]
MTDVYQPSDDSLFLYREVMKVRVDRVAEVGVGSGFVLRHYVNANAPDLALGTDLNAKALKMAHNMDPSNSTEYVRCRSCDCLREGSFRMVFFNPPYLINEGEEDLATSGGKTGVEVTYDMAVSSYRALAKTGRLVFLASSSSDIDGLSKLLHDVGIDVTELNAMKLFFEELIAFMAIKGTVNRKSR